MEGLQQELLLGYLKLCEFDFSSTRMDVITYLAELLDLNVILICFIHRGSETLAVWQKTL